MSCRRRRGYRRFSTSAYRLLGDFEVAINGGVWVATGGFRAKPTDQGWTVCGSCSIRGRFYVFIVVRHGTAKLHLRNDNNPKTPARLTKPQDSKQITLNCRNHPAANMNLAGQSHHTRAQPH